LCAAAETAYQDFGFLIEIHVDLACLAPPREIEFALPPVYPFAYGIHAILLLAPFPTI
jgi:hypothetical protein